jgi:transposase
MSKKRRSFSAQYKFETVMEGIRGEKSIAQLCRERDITDSLYYKWRDMFLERAPDVFKDQRSQRTARDAQEARIADLERLVGQLTLENEILKKASSWLSTAQVRNER